MVWRAGYWLGQRYCSNFQLHCSLPHQVLSLLQIYGFLHFISFSWEYLYYVSHWCILGGNNNFQCAPGGSVFLTVNCMLGFTHIWEYIEIKVEAETWCSHGLKPWAGVNLRCKWGRQGLWVSRVQNNRNWIMTLAFLLLWQIPGMTNL